jgi:hypothetical protein
MKPQDTVLPKSFSANFLRTLANELEAATPSIVEIASISIKLNHKVKPDGKKYDYEAVVKARRMPTGQQKAGVKAMLMDVSEDCDFTLEHRDDCAWSPVGR